MPARTHHAALNDTHAANVSAKSTYQITRAIASIVCSGSRAARWRRLMCGVTASACTTAKVIYLHPRQHKACRYPVTFLSQLRVSVRTVHVTPLACQR